MIKVMILLCLFAFNGYAVRNGVSQTHQQQLYLVKIELGDSVCTGVRISDDYILTAAHCFRKTPKRFKLSYLNNKGRRFWTKLSMSSVRIKSVNLEAELAVIKLNSGEFESHLPIKKFQRGDFTTDSAFEIAGFGYTQKGVLGKLHKGTLHFNLSFLRGSLPSTLLQLRPGKFNHLPCPGDSGGPLFYHEDGEKKLVGIVSYIFDLDDRVDRNDEALDQCKYSDRAVYIPLSEHMDFLEEYL